MSFEALKENLITLQEAIRLMMTHPNIVDVVCVTTKDQNGVFQQLEGVSGFGLTLLTARILTNNDYGTDTGGMVIDWRVGSDKEPLVVNSCELSDPRSGRVGLTMPDGKVYELPTALARDLARELSISARQITQWGHYEKTKVTDG